MFISLSIKDLINASPLEFLKFLTLPTNICMHVHTEKKKVSLWLYTEWERNTFAFVLCRLLDIHHLCAGMKPQAVQRVAKLLVPPRAQKYGILLPVIHQQGLQHLDGTHLVMQHQAMEVPLPAHVKIDGMKHLKQKEVFMAKQS